MSTPFRSPSMSFGGLQGHLPKGWTSQIKTQGFYQTDRCTNKDISWKLYLSLPRPFCYLQLLLIPRRGQIRRGGKESSRTGEKRWGQSCASWGVGRDIASLFCVFHTKCTCGQVSKSRPEVLRSRAQLQSVLCSQHETFLSNCVKKGWLAP